MKTAPCLVINVKLFVTNARVSQFMTMSRMNMTKLHSNPQHSSKQRNELRLPKS